MNTTVFKMFAAAQPGIEAVTAWELVRLGVTPRMLPGGAEFSGPLSLLYRTNLWLRTASRILVRVAEFKALGFKEVVEKVARRPWELYIDPVKPLQLRCTCRKSRLYHSGAVAERVRAGIEKRLGTQLQDAKEGVQDAQMVIVRVARNVCTVSIDSSGRHLHKRGYRKQAGPAPLRENLAAALLFISGWDEESPLMDPFCGSGTIPIEAALLATGTAPGARRPFSFQGWRNFDKELWESLLAQARMGEAHHRLSISGSDADLEMVKIAKANCAAAGIEGRIDFRCLDASAAMPTGGKRGWIVTNLPYGARLQDGEGDGIRRWIKGLRRFDGWWLTVLCPKRMGRRLFPRLRPLVRFSNGGIEVEARGGWL